MRGATRLVSIRNWPSCTIWVRTLAVTPASSAVRPFHFARKPSSLLRAEGSHLMGKLLGFIGATLFGAVGWWLGAFVGVMTAWTLSAVGTGVGIYVGKRMASHYDV